MTTTVRWVVQTNVSSEASEDKLCRFLPSHGAIVHQFKLVPFDDSPLDIPDHEGPTVFYGSTSLMRRVKKEDRWTPGVWYDLGSSSFETLMRHYGEELLNHDSKVMTLDEFMDCQWANDLPLFVRPTLDTKSLTGKVRSFGEWKEHITASIGQRGGPEHSTLIQVAMPKDVVDEWRVCIVNGIPVSASSYRVAGRFNQGGPVPAEMLNFARHIARVYSPQPVFMLDIARLGDDTLKVIETNCMNCAGFYWMDVYEIAQAVTDYVRNG
jgi:hypothetical protein